MPVLTDDQFMAAVNAIDDNGPQAITPELAQNLVLYVYRQQIFTRSVLMAVSTIPGLAPEQLIAMSDASYKADDAIANLILSLAKRAK